MLYDGANYRFSKSCYLHIVDRVGGGDSLEGGLIYALLNDKNSQEAEEYKGNRVEKICIVLGLGSRRFFF